MPEQEPRKDPLAQALQALWIQKDKPTHTALAARTNIGRVSVGRILRGEQKPSWQQVEAVVATLGAEPAPFRRLWEEAQGLVAAPERFPGEAPSLFGSESETTVVEHYGRYELFYAAAAKAATEADTEIRATYIRTYPPPAFTSPVAARYFETLLEWAKGTGRPLSRVYGVPHRDGIPNDAFLAWLKEHRDETRGIASYEARVTPWSIGADLINMCLIDSSTVFLTSSGRNSQQLRGMSMRSVRSVDLFSDYFEQLWHHAESLDDYLGRI